MFPKLYVFFYIPNLIQFLPLCESIVKFDINQLPHCDTTQSCLIFIENYQNVDLYSKTYIPFLTFSFPKATEKQLSNRNDKLPSRHCHLPGRQFGRYIKRCEKVNALNFSLSTKPWNQFIEIFLFPNLLDKK